MRATTRSQNEPASAWSGVTTAIIAVAIAMAYLLGAFVPADRMLSDLYFRLASRRATDDLVLVEMDARSLQKLSSWPWSRAYHAALIGRLMQAGATTVAFDVDFSADSTAPADAAFAAAIKAAHGAVVLASFAQIANRGDASYLSESVPRPAFGSNARIGLVNIFADADGAPRRYRLREDRLPGAPVTMAALLAAPPASAPNEFAIDYGIDPNTIRRLSYVDVLTGNFDPALVKGAKVLVGATAVELGDRYAVSRGQVLSGVEIQALAYETLALHRAIHPASPIWVLIGLAGLAGLHGLAGLLTLGHRRTAESLRRVYAAAFGGAALAVAIGAGLQNLAAVTIDTAPWLALVGAGFLLALVRHAERHAAAAGRHRRAALRQKALMECVFRDSFDGIMIADEAGRIELANAAAGRMLERMPAALIGQPIEILLPGIDLADPGTDAGGDGSPLREITLSMPDGRTLTLAAVSTRSRPLRSVRAADAGPSAAGVWVVTFRDESARRAIEEARELAISTLQATTTAKTQFLARISHELRTPLSAIIGFSTIIGEQSIGPVGNPKYAEYARDIYNGGQRLLDLVNDILDVTRIEARQYEVRLDVLEVRNLLESCCAAGRAREECGARSLQARIEPGADVIRSDHRILTKALGKLVSNALKFTAPDGQILLLALPGPGQGITIEIRDDGIGIAESAIEHVVETFSQVSGGLNRRHEGSGLGLYFANRLIGLLGGRLEIDSTLGVGTTVRLQLPDCRVEASVAA